MAISLEFDAMPNSLEGERPDSKKMTCLWIMVSRPPFQNLHTSPPSFIPGLSKIEAIENCDLEQVREMVMGSRS